MKLPYLTGFVALWGAAAAAPALEAAKLVAKLEAFASRPFDDAFADELMTSELAAVAPSLPPLPTHRAGTAAKAGADALPTVLAHGMGDACENRGMKSITRDVGDYIGTYSVCVPTGDTRATDTLNGFFLDMDSSVDVFAAKIRNDTNLAGGFNAIGFSQGNSLIRGYIQKYNDPPVSTHLSVHGTVSGVAGFPSCNPNTWSFCQVVAEVCGALAYNEFVQGFLFQADYFRDPTRVSSDAYRTYSQLAQWNNEGVETSDEIKANFVKSKYAMIKADGDSMVFPNEGEWWGHYEEDGFDTVLTMTETEWYKNDMWGLKTVDEAGGISFNSTDGDHLQFTDAQLYGWIDLYF